MIEEYQNLYLRDNVKLVQLMSIKHSENATIMNEHLMLTYGIGSVDESDPTSWRYYLHLAGEYHPSDTPMEIFSLDTSERIIFNKENLVDHIETLNRYRELDGYYHGLVEKYPTQETLIKGILFPVDIETAIEASDGDILSYPQSLIEEQEITLISEIQQWVYNYLSRWHVKPFMTTDAYYPASYQAVLYLNLVPKILNLRLKRAKTHEAHSFHIRAYLASHGKLDKYYDYFTHEQRLWLYRNILYIERHSGHIDTFMALIEYMLTKRKIPISEFSVRQYEGFDDQYYPNYHIRRSVINQPYNAVEYDYINFDELANKESTTAPDNYTHWTNNKKQIIRKFQNSNNGIMLSKDLESIMVDYSNAVPHTLYSIMINEWAYNSYHGNYKSLITFKNPWKSITHTCTTDVAYIYMVYLTLKASGILIDKLPTVHVASVLRRPLPTIAETISVSGMSDTDNYNTYSQIVRNLPSTNRVYSIHAFSLYSRALYQARLEHWLLTSNTHDMYQRAYVQGMINKQFLDTVIDFNTKDQSINSWLMENNLPTDDFDNETIKELIWSLFDKSTGFSIDKKLLIRDIQRVMIAVMKQLSSYSVQYMHDINDQDIIPLNWAAIRPSKPKTTEFGEAYIETIKGHIQPVKPYQYFGKESTPQDIDPYPFLEQNYDSSIDPTRRFSRGISLVKTHEDPSVLDYEASRSISEYSQASLDSTTSVISSHILSTEYDVSFKSLHIEISSGGQPMTNWMTQVLSNEEIQELMNQG